MFGPRDYRRDLFEIFTGIDAESGRRRTNIFMSQKRPDKREKSQKMASLAPKHLKGNPDLEQTVDSRKSNALSPQNSNPDIGSQGEYFISSNANGKSKDDYSDFASALESSKRKLEKKPMSDDSESIIDRSEYKKAQKFNYQRQTN